MSEARLPQAVASYLESLAPTQRVSDFVSRMPFIIPTPAAPSGCVGDADLSTRQREDTVVGEQSWETWHRLGRDAVGCGTTRHDSEGRPLALPKDSCTQCVNYGISDSQSCHKCMFCSTPLARGYRSYTSNGPQACQSCLRRSCFFVEPSHPREDCIDSEFSYRVKCMVCSAHIPFVKLHISILGKQACIACIRMSNIFIQRTVPLLRSELCPSPFATSASTAFSPGRNGHNADIQRQRIACIPAQLLSFDADGNASEDILSRADPCTNTMRGTPRMARASSSAA